MHFLLKLHDSVICCHLIKTTENQGNLTRWRTKLVIQLRENAVVSRYYYSPLA